MQSAELLQSHIITIQHLCFTAGTVFSQYLLWPSLHPNIFYPFWVWQIVKQEFCSWMRVHEDESLSFTLSMVTCTVKSSYGCGSALQFNWTTAMYVSDTVDCVLTVRPKLDFYNAYIHVSPAVRASILFEAQSTVNTVEVRNCSNVPSFHFFL